MTETKTGHILFFKPTRPFQSKKVLRKRVYAFIIDLFVISLIGQLMVNSFEEYVQLHLFGLAGKTQWNILNHTSHHHLRFVLNSINLFGYFFLSLYLSSGQTFGKLLMGLRIVNRRQVLKPLTMKDALLRTTAYYINYTLFCLPFFISFFRRDKSGLPDMLSATYSIPQENYDRFLASYHGQLKMEAEAKETQRDFFAA